MSTGSVKKRCQAEAADASGERLNMCIWQIWSQKTKGLNKFNHEFWVWKATGEMTEGKYDQVELITLPQAGPPEHSHIQDELFYFLEGTYRMKVGDQVFTASVRDFVRVPAETSHAWRCIGKNAGKILLTYIPGGIRGFLEEMRPLYLAPELDIPAVMALAAKYGTIVTGPPLTD